MNDSISTKNAKRLARLSVVFCLVNNIRITDELSNALSQCIMSGVAEWYKSNGREDFSPATELICDDAIKFAFERVQKIATLATISAMGAGLAGLDI